MKKWVILDRVKKATLVLSNKSRIDLSQRKQYLSDEEINYVTKLGIKVLPFVEPKVKKESKKKVETKSKSSKQKKKNVNENKEGIAVKNYEDTKVVMAGHSDEELEDDLIGKTPGGYVGKLN